MTKKKLPLPPEELTPDPHNLRQHPIANQDAIRRSLIETGPFRSIAVDRDGIVRAGNGVFEQAQALGLKIRLVEAAPGELIAVRRADLYGRAAERAALADNHSSDLSEWDSAALAEIARSDKELLSGIFADDEILQLAQFLAEQQAQESIPEPNLDMAEAYQQKWGTEVGQHWVLPSLTVPGGLSDLYIDDCRTLTPARANSHIACFTSPPYAEQRAAKYGGIAPNRYKEWFEAVQTNVDAFLRDDGVFFLNIKAHAERGERLTYVMELALAMREDWGWYFIDEFAWVKAGYPGDMGKRFKNAFEPIYQFSKSLDYKFRLENVVEHRESQFGGYVENLQHIQGSVGTDNTHALETVRPSNVLHISSDTTGNSETGGHPARFPPALPDFFIRAYSDSGDRWLDPFAGSGTVAVVCERLGRLSTSIELLPKYGAVILERYSQSFGITPWLDKESLSAQPRSRATRKSSNSQ